MRLTLSIGPFYLDISLEHIVPDLVVPDLRALFVAEELPDWARQKTPDS